MADHARTSPLGQALAGRGKPAADVPNKFRAAVAGARVYVPWVIPRIGLDVLITLVPSNEAERIEGEVFERMRSRGLDLNITTENTYELARAKRHLAIAFVDPTTKEPIGPLDAWESMDEDLIGECWRKQLAVRSAYDPISQPIDAATLAAVADAVKKKDAMLLRHFGTPALASYLLATAEQASNSPIPTSGPTASSPAS